MTEHYDHLIIGAGLAGSVLAWRLKKRGLRVIVVSDPAIPAASRAAAGLINPVTGQRLVLQENIDAILPAAKLFYHDIEKQFGIRLLHEKKMLRLFRNTRERQAWEKRKRHPAYSDYIETESGRPDGFIQHHTGWLDTNLLLDTLHDELRSSDALIESEFRYDEVAFDSNSVQWQGVHADKAIFCEGWRGRENPWFDHLPFQPAKGEILTIEGSPPEMIVNRGRWLLPVGERRYKLGATYDWEQLDETDTIEARKALLAALPELLADAGEIHVADHVAGVRPGTVDKQPFIGTHPEHPSIAIFNGFGSKGSLLIPWHAEQFTAHLLDDAPLPPDADIARF